MALQHSEIFKLHPSQVIVGSLVGLFWPDKAAAIGAKMQASGQNDPIKVRHKAGQWELVTGYHRLQGALGLGLDEIAAIEVEGTADELLDIAVSENLDRRDLDPIERALHVRAAVDLAEKRAAKARGNVSPQSAAIAARWSRLRDNVATPANQKTAAEAEYTESNVWTAYGWSADVAASLGMSRAALFDSLKIHRQLIAPFERELWEELARTALGRKRKALIELADIVDEGTRRLVIDTIVGDDMGQIGSVSDAKIAAGAKEPPQRDASVGQTKYMNNASSNLDRLSAASQRSYASTLAEKIKPSALLVFRAAIDARIAAEGGVEAIGGEDGED
jgi:hypothetical protein